MIWKIWSSFVQIVILKNIICKNYLEFEFIDIRAERWLSGWKRQSWKLKGSQGSREFESRPLRCGINNFLKDEIFIIN